MNSLFNKECSAGDGWRFLLFNQRRNPFAAVGDDVERIVFFVEFALLAVLENGSIKQAARLDGGESRWELGSGDEIADDGGPEAGERFVGAAVFSVLAAGRYV